MAHDEVNHDYHLVNPSPWPLVGSIGAFTMAIGAIAWMQTENGGLFGLSGPYLFAIGFGLVLFVMAAWWRDVIAEANNGKDHTAVVQIGLRYGMVLFIASEVMFFVAWFWAYFNASMFPGVVESVSGGITGQLDRSALFGGQWPPKGIETFDPWDLPFLNTAILVTSSFTVTWAHHALRHNDRGTVKLALWATVVLGMIFTGVQAYEYSHAAFGFSENVYGATFFMATGFHGFHVLVGTIFLFVCLFRVYAGHFKPEQHFGFEAAAWYWHFVDTVWIFLFAAIYVWGSWGAVPAAH
jgi:cytochrome c oxidase subunit III